LRLQFNPSFLTYLFKYINKYFLTKGLRFDIFLNKYLNKKIGGGLRIDGKDSDVTGNHLAYAILAV